MNMKKIELLGTRNLGHFHRERQSVVGTRKQSVVRKLDSMEMEALLRQIQPDVSLAWVASQMPIKLEADREHYLEGFRRAGLH